MSNSERTRSVSCRGEVDMREEAELVWSAIDGQWRAVDATTLPPRETPVRISTGRDASDTAFLTGQSGRAELVSVAVTATSSPDRQQDQSTDLVSLT
jgi:hypothetical protein